MLIDDSIIKTREAILKALNESGLSIGILDLIVGEIKTITHSQLERETLERATKTQQEENKDGSN